MNSLLVRGERWICGECGGPHSYEEDAYECCSPAPDYEPAEWECGECGAEHSSADDAEFCCSDMDLRTKLEAKGQQRLELEVTV